MHNFKHTIAAFLAVIMISSLAVSQAAEISSADADRMDNILDISDTSEDETSDVVYIDGQQPEEPVQLTEEEINTRKENVEFISPSEVNMGYSDSKLEQLKPFEPITGYVITTTGGLNVRAAESVDSEILTTLTYGQMIDIIDESDEWYTIPQDTNDGVGYVLKEYISTSYEEAKRILLESGVMYESGVVSVDGDALNVRSGAGTENTVVIDQITDGDCIIVLERVNDEWMKVYYGNNYSTGYVMSKYVNIAEMTARDKVAQNRIDRINAISEEGLIIYSSANCRQMPTENSNVIRKFSEGETCLIISTGSEWTKVAYGQERVTGYVKSECVMSKARHDAMIKAQKEREEAKKKEEAQKKAEQQKKKKTASQTTQQSKSSAKSTTKTTAKAENNSAPAPSSKGQAIVNAAAKYIGVKYVYGGTSPSGFDCSGLVQYACREAGISVNRTSRAQYSNGVAVSKSNLQAGDLVFFSKGSGISHVGIYAGNGQVIHSPRPGKSVCYIPLSTICGYSTYVGARRVY